jgi:hypothetical protein
MKTPSGATERETKHKQCKQQKPARYTDIAQHAVIVDIHRFLQKIDMREETQDQHFRNGYCGIKAE